MNRTCKEEEELLYKGIYVGEQSFCCLTSVAAVVLLVYSAVKYLKRVTWHVNTKCLLFYTMFVCTVMAVTGAINFGHFLAKLFYTANSCGMLMQVSTCCAIRWTFLVTFNLITLIHVSVIIVVAVATWKPVMFDQKCGTPLLSIVLIIAMTSLSAIVVTSVMKSEDPEELVIHCLSLSASHLGDSMYTSFTAQFIVEFMVLLGALALIEKNKDVGFMMYNGNKGLISRFRRRENHDVLGKLFPNVVVTAIIILLYLFVALIVRFFKDNFSKNTYIIVTFLFFVPPHLPLITAIVIHIMLRKHVNDKRKNDSHSITNTADSILYRNILSTSWDAAFATKHGEKKSVKKPFWKNKVTPLKAITGTLQMS